MMPYFCLFLSRSKIKHMVKKEAVFSDKLDYAFLLNNVNEEEEREGGGGKGRRRGRWMGRKGQEKKQREGGRLCWGALPFQDLLGWFSTHCTSSCWRACLPLLSSGAHSLSSETVPETFQEHPAEPVVPASQDIGEKLNLFLASRGTGMGWWAWQMRLWEEILQTLRRQGKAGVGGWAVLGWVIRQKTWGTGEHECDFLRGIPRKNEWGDGERDQEEKEASQGRNINQSPPWSLAQPCRDALGSTEVTSQDCPDQALGHPEESLMKGCPLGNTPSRHFASKMCRWVLADDKKMQVLLYLGSESTQRICVHQSGKSGGREASFSSCLLSTSCLVWVVIESKQKDFSLKKKKRIHIKSCI